MTTARLTRSEVDRRREARRGGRRGYDYAEILAISPRVNWELDDVLREDETFDFTRPFLPESLARTALLDDVLSAEERLKLNQIRGYGYLCTFGLAEEFILPFVLDHARPRLNSDDYRVRALLQFASEEAKHIQLFKRFAAVFERDFGARCEAIGPADEIAKAVLAHHPLAVALVILHIEWMTQRHYIDGVQSDASLCPKFKSLLKNHWLEEAQHAKLDTLMVEALGATCDAEELERAVEEYLEIGGFLDAGFKQQAALDVASLERAIGRPLSADDRTRVELAQHQAMRWTYLGSGMSHPEFQRTLERVMPACRPQVEQIVPLFC